MKQVDKNIFFNYVVFQGLKNIKQNWSNHTSQLTLTYVKRGKEKAKIVQGPIRDTYYIALK